MPLNTAYQQQLVRLGLLDPPVDGIWGSQSELALSSFCDLKKIKRSSDSSVILQALQNCPNPIALTQDFASRVVRYMRSQSYFVAVSTGTDRRLNLVYAEGCNPDGTLNNDAHNQFNDASLIIEIVNGVPKIVFAAVGTTEPGDYYTRNPMNSGGCFRIAFGQYKAWKVGIHGNKSPHEALVQRGTISGYRDANKDYKRTGDKLVTGDEFGVNQHCGYDFPATDIGMASAGCLLRRKWDDHYTFMKLVKTDVRYMADHDYTFMTAVVAGDKI